MNIHLQGILVRDLIDGYEDKAEEGVRGYAGRLNIRPAFQREFVYDDKKRTEVIKTVRKGFPLNTMYWAVAGDDFELMDGQQRTISVCQYIQGDFSVEVDGSPMFFANLTPEKKTQILDYELSVYVCEGTEDEKLDWFKIINIAGVELTDQELRNAIYTGPWLTDAKRWFSRRGGPAVAIGDKYVNARVDRQELLERALQWISGDKGDKAVKGYMSTHQHDPDAQELWQYFQEVIAWIQRVFPTYRHIMKGLDWGKFYNGHKDDKLNAAELEKRIAGLLADKEVESKKGIYEYLLTGNEKTLSLRSFDGDTTAAIYEKQRGICPLCDGKKYEFSAMEADHIIPWSKGGKTVPENCQMLCKMHNRTKSGK